MLENSPNQAHATVVVKAYASYGSCIGMWLNGLKRSPHGPFDRHAQTFVGTHSISYQNVQKSLVEQLPKPNRKSTILKIVLIFADLHMLYFNELLCQPSPDRL